MLRDRTGPVHLPDDHPVAAHPERRQLQPFDDDEALLLSRLFRFVRARQGERGQALVEFALLLPLMLLIITGLFDVARAVWQENTLAYAAREGTRYAIVHGSAGSPPAGPPNPERRGAPPPPAPAGRPRAPPVRPEGAPPRANTTVPG